MTLLLIELDPVVAGHLAVAIRRYRGELQRGEHWTPAGLSDIEHAALRRATGRQDATTHDVTLPAVDPAPMRLLLTKRETAHLLSVSVRTVERLLADGVLPRVEIGGAPRVRRSDLEAYIESLGGNRIETKGPACNAKAS